jgi:predicted CXXCH cytochrome family protein
MNGENGANGKHGAPGERGAQGPRGPAGDAGVIPGSTLQLEADGVVGIVRDPSGQTVPGGSVYFVPAKDVDSLAKAPIDLSLTPKEAAASGSDEPLEDLIDAHGEHYTRAAVGQDGVYQLKKLAAGSYFVVWTPAATDGAHLPGGSACRSALDRASLAGTQLDLRVSGRPSESATYVGSSGCFGCHGRNRSMRTSHRLSLQVPGVRGAFQDGVAWPKLDQGIDAFDQVTTLYYYDCDPSQTGEVKCSVSSTDPTVAMPNAIVRFEVALARNAAVPREEVGSYTLRLVNRADSSEATYPVALTYGGMLSKQHFLTPRTNKDGSLSYFVLPLQHNANGNDANPSRSDWVFRDYHSEQWYDFANSTLREPETSQSFDAQCAGCHFTGMRLTGDAKQGFSAHAIGEASGDFDYDGDGRRDEINIGCEGCHGPASEHLEATKRGLHIVSPSLLTPERELLVCGRCHSRPLGIGAGGGGSPLSQAGQMPPPGIRRSEFARGFTTRVDGDAADFFSSGDSKSNHAQYSDFLRTSMARNGSVLMTCTSCHDAHGSDQNAHELKRAANDDTACTGCHSQAQFLSPHNHVEKVTTFVHDASSGADLACTTCHMVRTATSGAQLKALRDNIPSSPIVQYYHGDIASHRFTVTPRSQYDAQPVAATLACGFCHGERLPNP